jgi:glycosidase
MSIFKILLLVLCLSGKIYAQNVWHMCPPNWWTGMNNPTLQIMMHGNMISDYDIKTNYEGVSVQAVTNVENKNYVFVDVIIDASAKPGIVNLEFYKNNTLSFIQPYELKQREKRMIPYGLNAADFIYLIMPDRFSNGDTTNDSIGGMREKKYDKTEWAARHGGDLQGIINHLDYIKNLGATAIWCTPLLENDQPEWSYHGYAATDHYTVDARFGGNEMYKKYAEESHKRGLKVVMDVVPNHCGLQHWMIQDLPMQDWIHQWEDFQRTNYNTFSLMDPYASDIEKKLMSDGWFDKQMPDMNPTNPFMAKYFTQNCIWWIEYAHVDGFRVDTYPYADLTASIAWKKAIDTEYPGFGMFGEVWVGPIATQSYFAGNNNLNTGYNSLLNGVTDFALLYALTEGLNGNFGWDTGLSRIYVTLTQDYVYKQADKNAIFFGNHDLDRYYSVLGEDIDKMKMAAAFLFTMRGIPQWYYGDEILMKNFKNPTDALVRENFPGGWPDDKVNKFDEKNLAGKEKEFFNYVKKLANYRKTSTPITQGKLMHYFPSDGMYVYFRYTNDACIMVVMNSNKKEMELKTALYSERMNTYTKAKNIVTDETISDLSMLKIPARSTVIYELQK